MLPKDMAFGVSQVQSLDPNSSGVVVPADAKIYWDKATQLKKISTQEIEKIEIVGRGGTHFTEFFEEYEKNIGKCDFLIVVTDGYLDSTDMATMRNPGVDVFWLITSTLETFTPNFGQVFNLHNM